VSLSFKDEYGGGQNGYKTKKAEQFIVYGSEMGAALSPQSNGFWLTGTTLQIPSSVYHTMSESVTLRPVVAFLSINDWISKDSYASLFSSSNQSKL